MRPASVELQPAGAAAAAAAGGGAAGGGAGAGAGPGPESAGGAGGGPAPPLPRPLGGRELGGLACACVVRGPLGLEGALAPGGAWVALLLGALLTPLWQAPLAVLAAELGTTPELSGPGGSVEWVRRTQGRGTAAAIAAATVLGSCAWVAQAGLLFAETAALYLLGGAPVRAAGAAPCPSPAGCAALFALGLAAALAPGLLRGARAVAWVCLAGAAALVAPHAVLFFKVLPQVAVLFSRRMARWPRRVRWAAAVRASAYLYAGHDRVAVFAADELAAREVALPYVLRWASAGAGLLYAFLYFVAIPAAVNEAAWSFGSLAENFRPAAGGWLSGCIRAGALLGALGALAAALFVASRLVHAAVAWDGGAAVKALAAPRWALAGVAGGAAVAAAALGYDWALRLDTACYMLATVFKFRALQVARAGSRRPPSFRQDRFRIPLSDQRVISLSACPMLIAGGVFFCCGWDAFVPAGALAAGAALHARCRAPPGGSGGCTAAAAGEAGATGRWGGWLRGDSSHRYEELGNDDSGGAAGEPDVFDRAQTWGKGKSRARKGRGGAGKGRRGREEARRGEFTRLAGISGSESE